MTLWWHLRKGGGFPNRFACSPTHWPIGIALTWYGRDLAIGLRLDSTVRRWAVDLGPIAVHGWWSKRWRIKRHFTDRWWDGCSDCNLRARDMTETQLQFHADYEEWWNA